MAKTPDDQDQPVHDEHYPEMDFRKAEFPSDALSIKRLRRSFPEHFDGPGLLADGYANNDFFSPWDANDEHRLVKLSEMISAERTVAAGAYYGVFETLGDQILNDEDHEALESCKKKLEADYQYFKLADSPETARLLIRQIEEEGQRHAHEHKSRGRG